MQLNSQRELARQKAAADAITTNRGDIKTMEVRKNDIPDEEEEQKKG